MWYTAADILWLFAEAARMGRRKEHYGLRTSAETVRILNILVREQAIDRDIRAIRDAQPKVAIVPIPPDSVVSCPRCGRRIETRPGTSRRVHMGQNGWGSCAT